MSDFDYSTGEVPDHELPAEIIAPTRRVAHRWANTVEEEKVDWIWYGYIPQTGMTFLDGDPEAGKTCAAIDIIARLTTGRRMPIEPNAGEDLRKPCNVAILAKEDRYENTIKPRLMAADADPSRVAFIDHVTAETENGKLHQEFITLPKHTPELADFLRETEVKLLLIDPFDNHLDDGLNTSSSSDMRRAFNPITEAAAELGCAILIIRHFGKKDYGNAKHKGLGSIGLTGMARSNLAAVSDGAGGFILGRIKGNLSRRPQDLLYQIRSWEKDTEVPQLHWCGTSDRRVDDVATNPTGKITKTAQAMDAIREILSNGPMPSKELYKQVSEAVGASERTIKAAKKNLDVKSVPVSDGAAGIAAWWSTLGNETSEEIQHLSRSRI